MTTAPTDLAGPECPRCGHTDAGPRRLLKRRCAVVDDETLRQWEAAGGAGRQHCGCTHPAHTS